MIVGIIGTLSELGIQKWDITADSVEIEYEDSEVSPFLKKNCVESTVNQFVRLR